MLSSIPWSRQALARSGRRPNVSKTPSCLVRRAPTIQPQRALVLKHPPTSPSSWPRESSEPSDNDFWRDIPLWRDVSSRDFLSWGWSVKNIVETRNGLSEFLDAVLPANIPRVKRFGGLQSREEFMGDIWTGIRKSTMAVRLSPYVLSRIDWKDPANDPIFHQFIPLGSMMIADHPMAKLDPLNERRDEPVEGVVHRYPDKALLLPMWVCPTYCTYCTRAHGVGANTELVTKQSPKISLERLNKAFDYIESQEGLHDIVVSGGDAFYIAPHVLELIGDRLIGMRNIERFRFASKGLAVAPHRFLDGEDPWTDSLIRVSDKARKAGKHMALHTHINHPNEVSWVTEQASLKLLQSGVTVRNQTVLLRGVNDSVDTMSILIRKLAKMVIQPYYVYQCDMVPGVEHLRTTLQTTLDIEAQIQGTLAGFFIPKFVVDLPGGGGKRLASLCESYDRRTGVSKFTQPALKGKGRDNKVYEYYDPVDAHTPARVPEGNPQ
ncbi:kama family protein [Hypoxylon sp. NC1633]|nr:kama family protein [Hypoxylon sp. NC1633]